MDSKTLVTSAISVRIMSFLGVFYKEMPSIKLDAYKQIDQNVWCAEVPLDDQTNIVVMYSDEEDGIRYMATSLMTTSHDKAVSPWYFIVVGDEEANEHDQNRIMCQVHSDNGVALFREASVVAMCSLLKGFETLRDHVPRMLPIKATKEMLAEFKSFRTSIPFEETEEENE
jgi:hypothetical protein